MSWIEKLYETYKQCDGAPQFSSAPLMPVSHAIQQAHVDILLDDKGNFLGARYVLKEETIIPATEESATRVGTKPPPHPLCDKIQYCAADYKTFGGLKDSFNAEYLALLRSWCNSPYTHPKVQAVLDYVEKGRIVADLVGAGILHCDSQQQLLTGWNQSTAPPEIFRFLTPKDGSRDQGDAFVRWRVHVPGDPISLVSEDPDVRKSWIGFDAARSSSELGLCMVTGDEVRLASSHPKRLRHGADGAKLISSNDNAGYTFRGRFLTAKEACGVSFDVTQKAHNALRWLIARQDDYGKTGDQVFVSWSVAGRPIPDPLKNTSQLLASEASAAENDSHYAGDAGQRFALQLKKLIAGYGVNLGRTDAVVIMGLDSASPGRMAITFYRELTGGEFLARVLAWHTDYAWQQKFSKDLHFMGAASPRDIADATYGRGSDEKLRKTTIERLLPCIVDDQPLPRDLVDSAIRRVCNRVGMQPWEWEKCLGITCGLVRGRRKKENYQMSLEEERASRDYLFGRLLAIADHLEQRALHVAGEERDTNAARMMQRFAEHPCSTWKTLELALTPYKTRLRSKRPGVLLRLERLLDEVTCKFAEDEFASDKKLSGEFLLGYHCQRSALWRTPTSGSQESIED